MRVISASRRTDIPAFYSGWFVNRLRAGFCHWINPFDARKIYRVSLRPEDCLAIVFWTRNPGPLLPHLNSLRADGYRFYFHFTINGYPRFLESHGPPAEEAVATFRRLAEALAPWPVFWRYDPILLGSSTRSEYHLRRFEDLSAGLSGYTDRCYFSFVEFYGKTARNLALVARENGVSFEDPSVEERVTLARQLMEIASGRGIALYSCCGDELTGAGIRKAHCVDWEVVRSLGADSDRRLKAAPTRQGCGCVESTDIGTYDTCVFGCAYCYATSRREVALARLRRHDPEDSILWRPDGGEPCRFIPSCGSD